MTGPISYHTWSISYINHNGYEGNFYMYVVCTENGIISKLISEIFVRNIAEFFSHFTENHFTAYELLTLLFSFPSLKFYFDLFLYFHPQTKVGTR